jgi:hypothetical protein
MLCRPSKSLRRSRFVWIAGQKIIEKAERDSPLKIALAAEEKSND